MGKSAATPITWLHTTILGAGVGIKLIIPPLPLTFDLITHGAGAGYATPWFLDVVLWTDQPGNFLGLTGTGAISLTAMRPISTFPYLPAPPVSLVIQGYRLPQIWSSIQIQKTAAPADTVFELAATFRSE